MKCPNWGSEDTDIPTVDIGVGEIQCGPMQCNACGAYQDSAGLWYQLDSNPLITPVDWEGEKL